LKTWIYLTVKEPVQTSEGEKSQWRLPTVEVQGEETLLDSAKRAIREKVGNSMDIYYPSNCPMTMDMHVFKEEERVKNGNMYGTKTFFMVVQHDEGEVHSGDLLVEDFAWFDRREIVERIQDQEGAEKSKLYYYLLNS
jgi:ADP-ribose pyrophosphatase YjhB (NUDIX family)